MFVDAKPIATFGETSVLAMPSPQPSGSLKRPPVVRTDSSYSSLSGLEQAVRSFQNFVKQGPPVQARPLPPPPAIQRRASSNSSPRSKSPSVYSTRRSSSVYSRRVSQWGSENSSWKSGDFEDEPLPPLPTLLPVAYSVSTPQLVEKQPTQPPLLQARTYSPLINTPSPTASRVSTPSPPPQHKPSILLPPPVSSVQLPQKHLRTVSLDQAKAEVNAPGAVHLLPEELRAQAFRKAKSHEAIRVDSVALISGSTSPRLPQPPTLIDTQGRRRTLESPFEQFASEYSFPIAKLDTEGFEASPGRKTGTGWYEQPLALQQRKASRDKATQALGINDVDEQRGRTRHRAPRNAEYSHYLPGQRTARRRSSSNEETDAQKIAQEYHSLLTEQYRSPTSSPGYSSVESDESIKNHMKMVPRPLFQTKPAAKLPGSISGPQNNPYMSPARDSGGSSYMSPHRLSDGAGQHESGRKYFSGSSRGPNPFERAFLAEPMHKRRSTSGSIPISPPSDMPSPDIPARAPKRPPVREQKVNTPRPGVHDQRVSLYYPHVAPRKTRKAKTKQSATRTQTPPMPLLSPHVIAQRLKMPDDSPASSPRRKVRPSNVSRKDRFRKGSNGSLDGTRPALHERIAKGAAKYADLLTKPSDLPERLKHAPITAAPSSPHLLPSPVASQQARAHLGWSDSAKTSYDASRSLIALPRRYGEPQSPRTPQYTHIAAPARPLDERAEGLRDNETPRRKGSIFGSVLDGWKESKAEKRREELKKIIKVVPHEGVTPPAVKRRSSTFGWM